MIKIFTKLWQVFFASTNAENTLGLPKENAYFIYIYICILLHTCIYNAYLKRELYQQFNLKWNYCHHFHIKLNSAYFSTPHKERWLVHSKMLVLLVSLAFLQPHVGGILGIGSKMLEREKYNCSNSISKTEICCFV